MIAEIVSCGNIQSKNFFAELVPRPFFHVLYNIDEYHIAEYQRKERMPSSVAGASCHAHDVLWLSELDVEVEQ